jgi:membrane protease YdiL (CAAX protease family)
MVVITEEQARAKEIDIETGRPPFTQKHSGEMNGLAALLVTAALSGRAGLANLTHRSVRWRVPVRWYLIALLSVPVGATLISLVIYGPQALATPSGGWPRALAEVAAVFVLQLVLFQLAEEIGFTGFLQRHLQDRFQPLKLTLYVALLWAVWHMSDHFAVEGWGVEQLIPAPVVFAIHVVSLFFARALFVWFYNRTGSSVLLVAIFHVSFDAAINQLSDDVVPGVEHYKILDLQRRNHSVRSNGDHRHQRPAGAAFRCGARTRSRRHSSRAHTR